MKILYAIVFLLKEILNKIDEGDSLDSVFSKYDFIAYPIIEKIKSGENIEILDNSGDWWFIVTHKGNIGFVHKSKIVIQ